jgi:hypothetical protein
MDVASLGLGLLVGLAAGLTIGGMAASRAYIDGAVGLARHLAAHGWYPAGASLCAQRWISRVAPGVMVSPEGVEP